MILSSVAIVKKAKMKNALFRYFVTLELQQVFDSTFTHIQKPVRLQVPFEKLMNLALQICFYLFMRKAYLQTKKPKELMFEK